jgi:RHS repeat-associated protein
MSPGIIAESDLSGNPKSEYVFFAGERVARKDFPGNAVSYYFSDHLKTASVITNATGTIIEDEDYYPWGGELQFINNDSNHYKFTGKERDSETGLDYFGARYYSNPLGRWLTPDWSAMPVPVPYADLTDPQTFNQYAYTRDIPTSTTDADGHGDAMTGYNQCQHNPSCKAKQNGPPPDVEFAKRFVNAAKELGSDIYNFFYEGVKQSNQIHEQLCECSNSANQNQSSESENNNTSKNQNTSGEKSGSGNGGMEPKEGETGGPGAGKRIPQKTQQEALQENQNANGGQAKCVFCKENVGEGTGNKINYDHATAKSKGGNNSLNNTNVTCEYCNKSKGTGDAPKNPKNNPQN